MPFPGAHSVSKIIIITIITTTITTAYSLKQDAQQSQRNRAAGCVIVFTKSRRLELGDNILLTL